jgi:hypothetical protein
MGVLPLPNVGLKRPFHARSPILSVTENLMEKKEGHPPGQSSRPALGQGYHSSEKRREKQDPEVFSTRVSTSLANNERM